MRLKLLPAAVLVVLALGASTAQAAAERLYIDGRGFGHGIGLSQYGARGFATAGKDYDQILRHYFKGTEVGRLDADREVRVLVRGASGAVSLNGVSQINGLRTNPESTYSVSGGSPLVIRRGSKTVGSVRGFVRATGPGAVGVGGVGRYRGAIEIRPSLEVVNALGYDDYVRGVISAEMPAAWPMEALKAQAVAARSYAVTTSKAGNGFEHYADTRSQVYRGIAAETARTDRAVRETAGQVMVRNGKPVITYFFSTSGGKTENVEFSFIGADPKPYLKGVEDPYERGAGSPRHTWRLAPMTLSQAESKLGGLVKGRLRDIRVTKRGASPRVVYADVIGTRGKRRVRGDELKSRFKLDDTWVSFTRIGMEPGPRPTGGDEASAVPRTLAGGAAPGLGAAIARIKVAGRVKRTVLGGVSPGRANAQLAVERRVPGSWETVARVRTKANGRYFAGLPGPGRYRFSYRGHRGPVVKVR